MKNQNYIISTIFASFFGVLLAYSAVNLSSFSPAPAQVASPVLAPEPVVVPAPAKPDSVALTFVGDIMLDRGVLFSVKKNGQADFNWLFTDLASLKSADILFANLEGPLSDVGKKVGSIYSFRMLPEFAPALAQAGFDILSLANNHIGDWTREAMDDTVRRLNLVGIRTVGVGKNKIDTTQPRIIEKNNLRIGFLAFSDVGPDWLSASEQESGIIPASAGNLPEIIRQASTQVDHLIISFHFSEEYQAKSNARQQYLARLAIDNGARLVIGHHPHVAEEVERYHDGLIAYSLGNFIFDQAFSPETMQGLVLEVKLDKKGILEARTRVSQQDAFFRPHLSLESLDV